ncbi:hypothetical protein B0H13DRAFT_2305398 [Mycena leptocephala]|nr:hypothetical protein B0H13DRAFT_2305398 [Mycena leptocephala]
MSQTGPDRTSLDSRNRKSRPNPYTIPKKASNTSIHTADSARTSPTTTPTKPRTTGLVNSIKQSFGLGKSPARQDNGSDLFNATYARSQTQDTPNGQRTPTPKRTTNDHVPASIERLELGTEGGPMKVEKIFDPISDFRISVPPCSTMCVHMGQVIALRTIIASSQIPQSTTLPWSPATSSSSPNYAQLPMVHTKLTRQLYGDGPLRWISDEDLRPADVMPGINVTVLLAEWNEVYEDCAMRRKSAVERGLFERSIWSTYTLRGKDAIPEVDSHVNIHDHRWYKTWVPLNSRGTQRKLEDS